ncbi:restriction endonuclease subunit S [Escherichia albertii]|uniref:restriction endonuclease subunit S n=1 Tax=Escherichia albertii TaxID=208962 RepID=UPI001AC0017E|nr:restriction endonuclease subunit S [Escherichia albertii]QST65317.1 restriction endonuclease subunit S [Escherichia albertii]
MSRWRNFCITELADFCNAQRIPLSAMERAHKKGNFPYYGASGIVDYIDNYIFDGSYILISEDGENLKSRKTPIAFEATGKFWVNNHAHVLKAKKPHLTALTIQYFSQLDLSPYLTGAAQPKLNKASLNLIPLYLPIDESEQKAIASILSSLKDKIDLLHRQNKTLESMAETLFRQWFIEETHADWEITTLDCHITVAKGLSYKGAGLTTSDNGIPLFSLNSVLEGGGYKSAGIKYYNGDFKERHIIKPGDIIVANTEQGHEYRLIGYPAIIPKTESELSIYTHHLFKISINDDSYLTNAFLYYLLCSKDMHEQVVAATNGSTVNQLSADGLQRPEFKLPPECMVKEFTTQIDFFWKKISINNSQIKNIESLRDTLLPKLMSGEVRVQYAEEAIASVA